MSDGEARSTRPTSRGLGLCDCKKDLPAKEHRNRRDFFNIGLCAIACSPVGPVRTIPAHLVIGHSRPTVLRCLCVMAGRARRSSGLAKRLMLGGLPPYRRSSALDSGSEKSG